MLVLLQLVLLIDLEFGTCCRCCCCLFDQRLLIKVLSSIADAPAADQSNAVVVADATDPEL